MTKNIKRTSVLAAAMLGLAVSPLMAEDWPMWGRTPNRNMVSPEKNPPIKWDVTSGENVKWVGQLGSQSYGNTVVAGGLVFVGTNNGAGRDKKYVSADGTPLDGGVLAIFRESDGQFLYQRYTSKHEAGRVVDWPEQGICSSVYAEGDRIWYCTSRCEVVCMDVSSLRKGTGQPKDVWVVDMMSTLNVFPHNMTSCSITAHGDFIYVITGNGVDDTHKNLPKPKAPSIICFNKNDGKVVWTDNSPGENVLHGQWSSPAIVEVNGQVQVIAALGDGWIYAFDGRSGSKLWWFDSNGKDTVYPTTRNELIATPIVVGNKCYIANGQDPEHGEGVGHLWCIDITKTGDVSHELPNENWKKPKPGEELVAANPGQKMGKPNPNSAVIWHFERKDDDGNGRIVGKERINRTISTTCVYNGLAFVPDFSGYLHCFDAETGQKYWTHDMEAAMWGSPLAIDGKIYLGDEEGDVVIFEASKELKVIATNSVDGAAYGSPIFANGTLYVMNREKLFAIGEKK